MRNVLFIHVLLIGCLFLAMPSFAQIATVTDNTCTEAVQCQGIDHHGCNQVSFSITEVAGRNCTLKASVDECGTNSACSNCLSEAYIYTQAGQYVTCIHSQCCGASSTGIHLAAGDYYLYCCKIDCSDDDCSACPGTCTARATVE